MILNNFDIRACYADTDAAGVIHHARYLEFFERSRTEWLERSNAGPIKLAKDQGLILVIRETLLKFKQPGRLNDILIFSHEITHRGKSQLTVEQVVYRKPGSESGYEPSKLASATFHLVCVDLATLRSTPLPDDILAPLENN